MPQWKIFTLTGLSETVFLPAPDLSAISGNAPQFSLYADVPATINSSSGIVSDWGSATQPTGGSRPSLITDSVINAQAIRFDTGLTLAVPQGQLDFLSQHGGTIYIVVRQRILLAGGVYTLFDSTGGGVTPGVQLRVEDPGGAYRILRFRVFNGTSWIIDHTGEAGAGYVSLKRCIIAISFNAAGVTLSVDNAQPYYVDTFGVTLPAGASGPFVIGGGLADYSAVECYQAVHDRAAVVANTVNLDTRFSADIVWTLAYDGVRNFSFPSVCKRNDGRYLAIYRDGAQHTSNDGLCVMAESTNGKSWVNYRTIADLTASSGNGLHDPNICAKPFLDGSIYVNWFDDAPVGHLNVIRFIKSADGGATWSAPARITNGAGLNLEVASAPIVEAYGKKHLPVYNGTDESGTTPWNAELYSTSNDFSTVTTVRIGTGTQVGSPGFSEVNVLLLADGSMFAMIRSELDMYENTAPDGVTWGTPVETFVGAHSAGRIYQDPVTLDIYYLGRHNSILRTFLYRRDHNTGIWNASPQAPGANASQGTCIYGAMVPGASTSRVLFVSGSQIGASASPADTHAAIYAQEWDTSVIRNIIPLVITPTSGAVTVSTAIDFTAKGAGNFVWSLHTNATGASINAGTGHYVAGSSNGTDVVRVADVDGHFVDANVVVTGAVTTLPDTGNLVFHFDPSITASVTPTSGSVNSVANQNGAASSAVSNVSNKPVYGTSTLNSLKTIDFTGAAILYTTLPGVSVVGFSDFTFVAVIKTGSTVAGIQTFGGHQGGGVVCRADAGVLKVVDYAGGTIVHSFSDLTITANTAHVVVFRRSGTTIDAWLDGVQSAVPGTVSTVAFQVEWPLGNDDKTTLFGEQFLGYEGEVALYSVAESGGNVTTASTNLKAKWGTA